jgi:glutamate racemase
VRKRVLIFDSGVGGLSVYHEIRHVLPDVDYIYLFDNARFPYGELPAQELVHRCCGLISRVVAKHAVDLVVIACNTASTQATAAVYQLLSWQLAVGKAGVVEEVDIIYIRQDVANFMVNGETTHSRVKNKNSLSHTSPSYRPEIIPPCC